MTKLNKFKKLFLTLTLILLGVCFVGCELLEEEKTQEKEPNEIYSLVVEVEDEEEVFLESDEVDLEEQYNVEAIDDEEEIEDELNEIVEEEPRLYNNQEEWLASLTESESKALNDRLIAVSKYFRLTTNDYDYKYYIQHQQVLDLDLGLKVEGIWVIFKYTALYPTLNATDFGFWNIKDIEYYIEGYPIPSDLKISSEERAEFLADYRQMAYISLRYQGIEELVEAFEYFLALDFVLGVQAEYPTIIHQPIVSIMPINIITGEPIRSISETILPMIELFKILVEEMNYSHEEIQTFFDRIVANNENVIPILKLSEKDILELKELYSLE